MSRVPLLGYVAALAIGLFLVAGCHRRAAAPIAHTAHIPATSGFTDLTTGLSTNVELTVSDSAWAFAVGTISNHTSRTYGQVRISIACFDRTGHQVESLKARVGAVDPNATARFRVPCGRNSSVSSVMVTGVQAEDESQNRP